MDKMCNVKIDTMSFNATSEETNRDIKNGKNIPKGKAKKVYQCKICGKKISLSQNYKVHMRIHTNEKPYSCEVCNEGFRESGQLKSHQRQDHSGEKPFQCKICDKSFAQVSNLQ